MTLTLVVRSINYPYGFLEYVLVKVDSFLFPANFVILDIQEDFETTLLLGRPFLAIGRALIHVELGELILIFNKEKVVFNIFEAMKHHKEKPQCYRIDIMEEIVQEVVSE